jgi:hypothetical protein
VPAGPCSDAHTGACVGRGVPVPVLLRQAWPAAGGAPAARKAWGNSIQPLATVYLPLMPVAQLGWAYPAAAARVGCTVASAGMDPGAAQTHPIAQTVSASHRADDLLESARRQP